MKSMKCPHGITPKSKCVICRKEYMKQYYRKYMSKYQQSPKYKESLKKYRKSLKFREYYRKYMKEYMRKYRRLHNPKVLNPTPAKPVSSDVVEIKGRVDKPHEETGGRLNGEAKL
jgi:hypothetical protein